MDQTERPRMGIVRGGPEDLMKRCPECRRDYYDETLLYCLDDGTALLEGPGNAESATAILPAPFASDSGPFAAEEKIQRQIAITGPEKSQPRKNFGHDSEGSGRPAKQVAQPRTVLGGRNRLIACLSFAVLLLAGFIGYRYLASIESKQIESIAVLPFVNESGNPDIDYLSDGMTDTLIGSLAQLPNLSVKARSSVFRYKGKDTDLSAIGRELGVQAILTGRVVQRGDQLTISLSLIDAATENVIWAEPYNRKLTDVVSLQSEIARVVSSKLKSKLTAVDEKVLAKNYPQNAEAYHEYLKGRFYWDKGTANGYEEAIRYFSKAIEKDPNYALAYAGLANTYVALGIDHWKPKDTFPFAKLYAERSLDLAPDLAEAHAALGSIKFFYEWDWSAADSEMKRIIALNPESAESYACTLHYLDSVGQPENAVAEVKRVAQQHPTSVVIKGEIGCSSYYAHRYDDAIFESQRTIEMDPGFAGAYYNLGRAYGQKKMYKEAIAALTKAQQLSNSTPYVIAELAFNHAASGDKAGAQSALHALENESTSKYLDKYLIAVIYIGMRDKEKALAELEKALVERSSWMVWVNVEPKFDSLHSEPRFQNIVRQVGLPQ